MKQFFFMLAFLASIITARAQETVQSQSSNNYYNSTRQIEKDRVITPYGIEVSFSKTVHIIFPASVNYVDLGSANIIAGKADGSENVVRVKAAVQGFKRETNFSVITDEGSFYSFNVTYADDPDNLNIEMKDFIHYGMVENPPNNTLNIHLEGMGSESLKVVNYIMRSIYFNDKREIKHIGSNRFSIQFSLKGIYTYNDFLFFHIQTKNDSYVAFDIDFIRIKIVDKKMAVRTAIQEQVIHPVRTYHYMTRVNGKRTERTVFTFKKFTIPYGKQLVIELFEKNGARYQHFVVENEDILRARKINNLKIK